MTVLERKELRPMLVAKYPREKTYLLPVLHFIQEEFDFIPEWTLQIVSWHLKVPASEGMVRQQVIQISSFLLMTDKLSEYAQGCHAGTWEERVYMISYPLF